MEILGFLPRSSHCNCCFLLIVMLSLLIVDANVQRNEIICNSIDIRNKVDGFKKLENCTVIEGYLRILLIDRGTPEQYQNLSFPALREITGYLLLFRANGLTNVGKLFPNLVVIRGGFLFHNFALVIFEMGSLREVGLTSLTDILRGNVRIEKNPDLCYIETIDWGRITHNEHEGNYIQNNKKHSECPDICPVTCPKNSKCPPNGKGSWVGDWNCSLCWGTTECQTVCRECRNGNKGVTCFADPSSQDSKHCCSEECLGGCSGPTSSDCFACKHFVHEGRCVKSCPNRTYEYLGRRCITEEMCKYIKSPKTVDETRYLYKPFRGQCLRECPPGYTTKSNDEHSCEKCKSTCPKRCNSISVDSVGMAQLLKDCTSINGSLEIQLQGGGPRIYKELEENLKEIQEITGYLKITRTPSITSLNFLKKLRYINGNALAKNVYAFEVLDNPNLKELWDWKTRTHRLEITKGKISFHYNEKLCLQKINDLKNLSYARVTEDWDETDVSLNSNGNHVPCDDVHNLEVQVFHKTSDVVGLVWNSSAEIFQDYESLLSYVVSYKEAVYKNVTVFEGGNTCIPNQWKNQDVILGNKSQSLVETYLTQLRPYTQYAYYIKAYFTSSDEKAVRSKIQYFKTEPSTPSIPIILTAESSHPNEIVIEWNPPVRPNGVITNYTVVIIEIPELPERVFLRHFCDEAQNAFDFKQKQTSHDRPSKNESLYLRNNLVSPPTPTSDVQPKSRKECCTCDENNRPTMENQIKFEDAVLDIFLLDEPSGIVVNHINRNQSVISVDDNSTIQSSPEPFSTIPTLLTSSSPASQEDVSRKPNIHKSMNVSGSVNYLKIDDLKHFTMYAIEVKACQSVDPEPPDKMGCSINAISSARTLPLAGADDIPQESIFFGKENISLGSIFVKWKEPKEPNGLIVSYHIEHKMAQDFSKPIVDCITGLQYKQSNGHHLVDLSPGNYSVRIRATSQARPGNWTRPVFFIIPAASSGSLEVLWIILPIVLLIVCLVCAGGYVYFKRKFGMVVPGGILYASVNPEYMSAGLVYEPDEWELPRDTITLIRELGQGTFGMVYEGEARNIQGREFMKCAVKTVNESALVRDRIEFLQEASVMKAFNCHHVVKLLGVVSKGHPTLVVMELMARGDLKSYLRSHRPDELANEGRQPPTLRKILQMAIEIADGMAYLAAKKFVHRDLAARNCMVAEDLTVKIGDFGMTRDIYETDYYRKGGKGLLPVRWMAPESLKDGVFTSQSDVWSYGVVLWEMSTLAFQPYQGLSNEQVLKYVISGGLMEMPENCPEKLYALMKMCWHISPRSRPTFSELIEVLLPDVSEQFREVSFYFTERSRMLELKEEAASELVSSSTPLKSPSALESASLNNRDSSDDDELDSIQFFPTRSPAFTDGSDRAQCENGIHSMDEGPSYAQFDLTQGGNQRSFVNSNSDGSKGMSLPSSDGSKVSNVSNGSLATGNASTPFSLERTTIC